MSEIPMNERAEMVRLFVEAFGSVDGKAVATPNLHKKKNGGYKLSVPAWCIHDYDDTDTDKLINSLVQRLDQTVYMSVNLLESGRTLEELELKKSNCNANVVVLRDFFIDLDIHAKEYAGQIEEVCNQIVEYVTRYHYDCATFILKTGHGLAIHHIHEHIKRGQPEWQEHINAYTHLFDRYKEILHDLHLEEIVQVDTKVRSLSRVCKVPGTRNADGTYCRIAYMNAATASQTVDAIYRSYRITEEERKNECKKKARTCRKEQRDPKTSMVHDANHNWIPKVSFQVKSLCIAGYNRLLRLFPLREWTDGDNRGTYLFLVYNLGKVVVGSEAAYEKMMELRDQMAEPKEMDIVRNAVNSVDEHWEEGEGHADGFYIYHLDTIASVLNLTKEERKAAGFDEIEDQKKQIIANRELNTERDHLIAQFFYAGYSSRAIAKLVKKENENMKCSYKTVQRAIDRLGLTRVDAIEKVEFERHRVYANYKKNRKSKKVGQHSPNTSLHLLSYMGDPIPGSGTRALEDTVYAEGTTQKICLMTDTEDNRKAFMASIQSGRNAICIGGPGTGKSYLMTKFVETHTGVLVMAPSGAAADRVNGMTIHHAFHLRQGCYGPDTPVTEDEIAALHGINCICIDEVGNLRRDIFHHIMDIIASAEEVYKKHIQILLFGDFEQLKPVCTSTDRAQLTRLWGQWKDSTILSDPDTLERLNLQGIYLTMVKRQKDPEYQKHLKNIREGNIPGAIEYFNKRADKSKAMSSEYMHLCPYTTQVNEINNFHMQKALSDTSTKRKTYLVTDTFTDEKDYKFPFEMTLFIGERVMAIQNGTSYKNGTLGTIIKLNSQSITILTDDNRKVTIPKARVYTEDGTNYVLQIPVVPAYAMTIHKAQGATLDKVVLHGGCFEAGQLYVGLSRTRCIDDLVLAEPLEESEAKVDRSWLEYVSICNSFVV